MSEVSDLQPENAAIDMLSGYAVDSFFSSKKQIEPWNEECLKNFIDIIINHDRVFFPLPFRSTIEHLGEPAVPNIFKKDLGFVQPLVSTTAEDYLLTEKELSTEFEKFTYWSKNYGDKFKSWMKYQRSIKNLYTDGVISPKSLVKEFLEKNNHLAERKSLMLTKGEFIIAFDIFARTGQYYNILGDSTPYFCHPFRSHACSLKVQEKIIFGENWSWGRYLVDTMKNKPNKYKSIDWVNDKVSIIRKMTKEYDASWYQMKNKSKEEQIEIIKNIASNSDLPAKLNNNIVNVIDALSGSVRDLSQFAVKSQFYDILKGPLVIIIIGSRAFNAWDKTIPGKFGKYRLTRGFIEWPELIT